MAQSDPGIQALLNQISSLGSGGGGTGFTSPTGQTKTAPTLTDIQQLLMGTARQQVTSQPFIGPMPSWVPQSVRPYVRSGAIDPYLGTGDASGWHVFMGRKPSRAQHGETRVIHGLDEGETAVAKNVKVGGHAASDKVLTLQQAVNQPLNWSSQEISDNIKKFQAAGFSNVTDFDTLQQAWGSVVQRAAGIYSTSSGQKKVTPWDVLNMYKTEAIGSGTYKDPNRTEVHVSRSVSDISEGDAWQTLQGTLSNMLGRDPSDQEMRDFTYRMNSLAAHNPSITKTISKYKNGEIDSQSSHTSQGFGAGDVAEQAYSRAQADPDYAEYQAGTTYFNALMSALGPIGG